MELSIITEQLDKIITKEIFKVFAICILQTNLSLFHEMELKWHDDLMPFSGLYDTAAEILGVYLQILGCSAIELDQILLFTLPYPGSIHYFTFVVVW